MVEYKTQDEFREGETLPSPTATQWDSELSDAVSCVRFDANDELLQKLSNLIDINKAEATVASGTLKNHSI